MEIKRRLPEKRHPLSSTSKHFRRVLYGLIGVVLSSYVVLFILVMSRIIDQSAQDEVRRALAEESKEKKLGLKSVSLVGGIGHSLLRMERYQERWAAMARVLNTNEVRSSHIRRRINVCVQPKFRKPPGPMIALASFPGSGNTWIRFLIQQATVNRFLASKNIPVAPQPPYSPDLSPCDFFLFPKLKIHLKGHHFGTLENIQTAVTDQLKAIPISEFHQCYEEWKKRLQRCVDSEGSYFEGDNVEL
ncbi:uncharacterized protein TNCV_4129111 [Trichonephila clavipes]|nr:uncharacterized protein TNCV_4129111 [Trichonephila clavipes]